MDESDVLGKMHELLLQALRSREQEVFKYLGILGPALGGFGWLLYAKHVDDRLFVAGTIGVLLLLLLGAQYSLALGYNYRYITLQLAKIETQLSVKKAMLRGWPKCPEAFRRYKRCYPPEVICVFWLAFVVGIFVVTLAACILKWQDAVGFWVAPVGTICFVAGAFCSPRSFGSKLIDLAAQEIAVKEKEWIPLKRD